MKILIVSHEYPPVGGGGANACMHLAKEYSAAGHEVHIVTVWYQGEAEQEHLGENIDIYRLRSKRTRLEQCSFKEMLDFLFKAVAFTDKLEKKEKFDICQIFFGIPSGPIGYYLKKKYRLPYVIRFGGGDIPGFQDRFTKVYKLIGPAIKLIWKNADALVANSRGLQKMAYDFCDKYDIRIIPNGAEIMQCESGHQSDESIVHLLFVSRLIERKGVQDILPQLPTVVQACNQKGRKIVLDIVGDGPYRPELENIVKTYKLDNIVRFHGQKNKSELPQYYSESDIFVFPSRKEGMPNVVLEAMSYGLPIIMTPCQGSEELIQGNGYIEATRGFSEKITELVLDEDKRKLFGERSKERIKDLSWSNVANAYIKVFDQICVESADM
ncbi:Glycosyltransferase involved in cell wall bisynthesis [Butyrivibrio hungatei DSM 14810]|uniref:Glycosyltransferase involved in cell wall bisynthesis n=1 Tax=Butyrivibrio hungatei DSM 14810 TaxID=1121132 RepID=A0A1M7T543_9FIRM|nr:glycosyltransferase family 4 protein [Butyrivibrio hungatei]SHN65859.1 Glycosyltransferase involved in cell wall bisynthesis [Butyrivibrio hungatei DSM 14810]